MHGYNSLEHSVTGANYCSGAYLIVPVIIISMDTNHGTLTTPLHVINSQSVDVFKNNLDDYWRVTGYGHDDGEANGLLS